MEGSNATTTQQTDASGNGASRSRETVCCDVAHAQHHQVRFEKVRDQNISPQQEATGVSTGRMALWPIPRIAAALQRAKL